MLRRLRAWIWVAASSLVVLPARGAEPDGNALGVDVHAFVSQGYIHSLKNNYLAPDTTSGSFRLSEVGINITKNLADNFRVGAQLYGQNLGYSGSYVAKLDWFYLDYRWRDWLGLRVGRLKIPFGFFNEFNDVDSGRVPILLPQSVYPLQTRDFLFAQSGFELYGFTRSPALGALDYRLYGGTIYIDPALLVPPGTQARFNFNVPYVLGGRVVWESPIPGFRIAASAQALRLDLTAIIGDATVWVTNHSLLAMASAEYAIDNTLVVAEYSRWYANQDSNSPPSVIDDYSQRMYAMVTQQAARWLQGGAYYSLLLPTADSHRGRANHQHDVALTLRFDLTTHWLFKLEGHYMVGTAGLSNPLSVEAPLTDLARTWGVFLAKTTAYF